MTAGVPFHCTPSATDSQSGIAPFLSAPCSAGPGCSRGFGSSVAAAGLSRGFSSLQLGITSKLVLLSPAASVYADCAEPILVSSPLLAPIPPPPLRHPSPFRRPGSHVRTSWHRAFILLSAPEPERPSYLAPTSVRPAPDALFGLPAHSPEDRKNDADASHFQTSSEPSGGLYGRLSVIKKCRAFSRPKVRTDIYKRKNQSRRNCARRSCGYPGFCQ